MANLQSFTGQNFQAEVLQSSKPVLVDFSADWCQPCKQLAPILNEIAAENEATFKFGMVDTDADMELAASYEIASIPSLLFFKNGKLHQRRLVGFKNKNDILQVMKEVSES